MIRLRTLATTLLPAIFAGGLMFHSASAQPVNPYGPPPAPPASPAPPVPPVPPTAPVVVPPQVHGPSVRVSVDGHVLDADQIRRMVDAQLAQARAQLQNPNIPARMRAKLARKLDKITAKLDQRLAHIDFNDLGHLQEQMTDLGNELSQSMDGMGDDMEAWGKQLGAEVEQQVMQQVQQQMHIHMNGNGQFHWDSDGGRNEHEDDGDRDHDDDRGDAHDDDDNQPAAATRHGHVHGHAAADRLGDLDLQPQQRERLAEIRTESRKHVAAARAEVAKRSAELETLLHEPEVDRDAVARAVEAVTAAEGEMRKAKILSWVDARRVLDDAQRKRVEGAVDDPWK
jgi:hypothetical protein